MSSIKKHITLICSLLILTNCATHRSHTSQLTEEVTVSLTQALPSMEAEGFEPLVLAGTVAVKVLAEAVKWEAKKYTDESVGLLEKRKIHFVPTDDRKGYVNGPFYIGVLRTVRSEEEEGTWYEEAWDWLTSWDEPSKLEQIVVPPPEPTAITSIFPKLKEGDCAKSLLGSAYNRPTLRVLLPADERPDQFLGMAALLRIVPSEIYPTPFTQEPAVANIQAFRIELLGYRYSALKAKNLRFPIPFTNWNQTDSVLRVAIKGPIADRTYSGNAFEGSADFKIVWDRDKSKKGDPSLWQWSCKPVQSSSAIQVPFLNEISIEAKIVESSSLKEVLEKASEKVKEIKIK
jgi:hypothetical protein